MKNPLVSICIPIYNGELYLRECLDSACSQDYLNVEIIIVDDQSTDNSIAIVNEYIQKDKRIKLFINEKNLGLVGNWNACINKSSGEWIKYLFQDDTLIPTCVSRMMQFATDDISIISCDRIFIFENGVAEDIKDEYKYKILSPGKIFGITKPALISSDKLCKMVIKYNTANFIGEPNVLMFRKNLIDKFGYFDPLLYQICDFEYCLRVSCNVGLFYIPEVLTSFRVHLNSTTASNKKANIALLDSVLLNYQFIHSTYYKQIQAQLSFLDLLKMKFILKLRLYEAQLWIKNSGEDHFYAKFQVSIKQIPDFSKYAMSPIVGCVFYSFILFRRRFLNLIIF